MWCFRRAIRSTALRWRCSPPEGRRRRAELRATVALLQAVAATDLGAQRRLAPRSIRSFRRTLIASCAARGRLKEPHQLLSLVNLRLDKYSGEQLLRPTRGERKAGEKRSLAFQYLKRWDFPFLRQTEDDLLDPGWAQRLSEIRVTDYPPEKIELLATDFVGVVGRLDQCFDLGKKSVIGRHYVFAASRRWRSGCLSDRDLPLPDEDGQDGQSHGITQR